MSHLHMSPVIPLLHPGCLSPDHFYTLHKKQTKPKQNHFAFASTSFPLNLEQCICPGWDGLSPAEAAPRNRGWGKPWGRCHSAVSGWAWGPPVPCLMLPWRNKGLREGLLKNRSAFLYQLPKGLSGLGCQTGWKQECFENAYKYPYVCTQAYICICICVFIYIWLYLSIHGYIHTHTGTCIR